MKSTDLKTPIFTLGFDLPWFEVLGHIWKIGKKFVRGMSHEGIYEVLDFDCELELKDKNGKLANIRKRETVRYLQDYVTAYQDQAWGDGKILQNYRCSPGKPVDEYRLGHNTYKLISLREFRNRGDVDEFNVEWSMLSGFLKPTGFWGISVNHRTKKISQKVIFPKSRPPLEASITESNLQQTHALEKDSRKTTPDGRPMIIWEKENPRLYENYILKWEW